MNLTGQVILLLFFTAIVFYNIQSGLRASQAPQASPTREPFETTLPISISIPALNSMDILQKNPAAQCDTLYYGSPFLADSNDLLQARYCLQFKHPDASTDTYDYAARFKETLTRDMGVFVQSAPLEAFETESLRDLIRKKLFYFKLANRKDEEDDELPIQGPVFAIITQAPYMLDDKGDVIYHQPFNREDYPYAPAFAVARATDTPPKRGLRMYLHLVYLMYQPDRTVVDITAPSFDFADYFNRKMRPIQSLKVAKSLCGIRCAGEGIRGLLCGCVNQTTPYLSRCLGNNDSIPSGDIRQNDNQLTDYMMLYRIQESSSQVRDLFSATYFEDVKV